MWQLAGSPQWKEFLPQRACVEHRNLGVHGERWPGRCRDEEGGGRGEEIAATSPSKRISSTAATTDNTATPEESGAVAGADDPSQTILSATAAMSVAVQHHVQLEVGGQGTPLHR